MSPWRFIYEQYCTTGTIYLHEKIVPVIQCIKQSVLHANVLYHYCRWAKLYWHRPPQSIFAHTVNHKHQPSYPATAPLHHKPHRGPPNSFYTTTTVLYLRNPQEPQLVAPKGLQHHCRRRHMYWHKQSTSIFDHAGGANCTGTRNHHLSSPIQATITPTITFCRLYPTLIELPRTYRRMELLDTPLNIYSYPKPINIDCCSAYMASM